MSKKYEAQQLYRTLCSTLDNMNWTYNKSEPDLTVKTGAKGQAMDISLFIKVDAERGVMFTKSQLPFTVAKNKLVDMACATTVANYTMLNGCFELDVQSGNCYFKIVVPYLGSLIAEETCKYMINLTCQMVDKFDDKLKQLAEDQISLEDFMAFANQ